MLLLLLSLPLLLPPPPPQVEDIIDSGHTLNRLSKLLEDAGAPSVKVVALLDKKGRRRVEFFPDYVGWEVSRGQCAFCWPQFAQE